MQAAQPQAQAAQVQPVQVQPVPQANPLAGLIAMADAKRIALSAAEVVEQSDQAEANVDDIVVRSLDGWSRARTLHGGKFALCRLLKRGKIDG